MEQIPQEIRKKVESLKALSQQNSQKKKNENLKTSTSKKIDCDICKDTELIINKEKNSARECKCVEAKRYQKMIEKSGLVGFRDKTFKKFNTDGKDESIKIAKVKAQKYCKEFNNNSICFLGQVGAGKTHLAISIANYLLKNNIGVLYMQYREAITELKQCITDEVSYQRLMSKYKKARILLIDDLFKGKITQSDLNIMFEIVNYRYLNKMPLIVSSEFTIDKLLDFDEATGSRILEMARGNLIQFEGDKLNHRLRGD